MSSGCPGRPSAMRLTNGRRDASSVPTAAVASVWVNAGATLFSRTPREPQSSAKDWMKFMTAAFVAL